MEQGIKVGPKPKGRVKIKWSADFAYAIGLIATDGCLSKDERHIDLTSIDIEQINNFQKCLGIHLNVGKKQNGTGFSAFRIQIGDVLFYEFLRTIGLSRAKSLTMGKLDIPSKYFFDFLRGCLDGDGSSYSYWDPRWKSSFMFYVCFASGSKKFIDWLRTEIDDRLLVKSHISVSPGKVNTFYQLKYSKYAAVELARKMYEGKNKTFLKRKKLKINQSLGTMGVPRIR